jgi:diguanylate cyclase (GGDEF)-like protein/PAS domain S-box-containing protein
VADGRPEKLTRLGTTRNRSLGDNAVQRANVSQQDVDAAPVSSRFRGAGSIGVGVDSSLPQRTRSPRLVAVDVPTVPAVPSPEWTNGSFRDLLESAPDAMVIVDSDWKIVLVNAAAEKLFGYPREELLGRCVEMLSPERFRDDQSRYRAAYSTDPKTRAMGAGLELCARRKDGTEFPVEISLSPIDTEAGTFISSAIRDITGRKRAERAASHFIAVVEASSDAIIGKDLEGRVVLWNQGAERLYGYTEAEMYGKSISVLVPPGHDDEVPELIRRAQTGERVEQHETVRARKDGTQVEVSLTVSPIYDRDGNVTGAATIARDISARLRYQEQLRFLAEHDPLTGAHNRRHFEREISDQVGRARRYGERAAVLFIDVDGLKKINDAHGHKAGDRALKEIASAAKRRLRETDVLARIGGDEFAVLLPYADAQQADAISEDLRRATRATEIKLHDGTTLSLSASVGFALVDRGTNSDEILAQADRAMYEDKTLSTSPFPRRS